MHDNVDISKELQETRQVRPSWLFQLVIPAPITLGRGTRRIVSVNYPFGRLLIPYNFLKGIFTSNFRDMGNLRPRAFGLIKMSFRVPKKGQLRFSERK